MSKRDRPWPADERRHYPNPAEGKDSFDCGIDWDQVASQCDPLVSQPTQGDIPKSQTPFYKHTNRNTVQLVQLGSNKHEKRKFQPFPSHATSFAHQKTMDATVKSLNNDSETGTDPKSAIDSLPSALKYDMSRVRPVTDGYRKDLLKHADLDAPLLNGWTLFPHQKKAVSCGILMRRIILALDMGLGKTLIGCVWSKAFCRTFKGIKVLIICPVSLHQEWRRTARDAVGLDVSTKSGHEWTDTKDVSTVFVSSWAKVPRADVTPEKFVIVADEAHSLQNAGSARTVATMKLALDKSCLGILLLTGTPMKNGQPSNLFPLLKAVRHPLGRHQRAFEVFFCAGRDVRYGPRVTWVANGAENVPLLRRLTKLHILYLTKEACLEELPPQTREIRKVPVSHRFQLQYNAAVQQVQKAYNIAEQTSGSNDTVLGAIQRLRLIGALAKIDAAVQIARDVLQNEPAVVVFTSFCAVAKAVHKRLQESGWAGELLTGSTPPVKRQDLVDRFQEGLSPVFVSTFGAGGVGLTLTAAHTIILIDRPWTPGDAHQAEDRVRRIGQKKPVQSIWMTAFEVDGQIDKLLQTKSNTADAVLRKAETSNAGPAVEAPVARSILKSVLATCTANKQS